MRLAAVTALALLACGAPEASHRPTPQKPVSETKRDELPADSLAATDDVRVESAPAGAKKKPPAKKEDPLFPRRDAGGWKALAAEARAEAHSLADDYVVFLAAAATPRRAVAALVGLARAAGATALTSKGGSFRYSVESGGDAAVFFRPGVKPVSAGLNIVVVSVDAPRIELKQRAVTEKHGIAMLETRTHGNLELRSWMVYPLALDVHLQRRKRAQHVSIGESAADPVLSIPDLLPHLSQGSQTRGREVDDPERLDALAAMSRAGLVHELERRGLNADDFTISESALVPATSARRVGVDRALIGGYGQANRALAFAAVRALSRLAGTGSRAGVVVVLGRTHDGGAGIAGYPYVKRALTTAIASISGGSGGEPDVHDSQVSLSRSDALVGAPAGGAPSRGVMLDPGAADTLPAGFRRVVETLTAAKIIFAIQGGSNSSARDVAALGVDAITVGIASSGQGTPGELVSVYDLYQGARACSAWLSSASR